MLSQTFLFLNINVFNSCFSLLILLARLCVVNASTDSNIEHAKTTITCLLRDLCVGDQCSRTVASVKAKLHLMIRPYYILTGLFRFGRGTKRHKNRTKH